ncbi:MAG: hypothetical protein Q9P14_01425 [candidate division KSB1 bacterium]|nr:hypothetical protein [candidate division KSB1 bacterium]MDQ7065883.1 hypothetical protein [candidate division KSB1 bacterium]
MRKQVFVFLRIAPPEDGKNFWSGEFFGWSLERLDQTGGQPVEYSTNHVEYSTKQIIHKKDQKVAAREIHKPTPQNAMAASGR